MTSDRLDYPYRSVPPRAPGHPQPRKMHAEYLDGCEASLKQIAASKDAALVEAMAAAAHARWRAMMGRPLAWELEDINERDAIRLGIHAALLAARAHARTKGPK